MDEYSTMMTTTYSVITEEMDVDVDKINVNEWLDDLTNQLELHEENLDMTPEEVCELFQIPENKKNYIFDRKYKVEYDIKKIDYLNNTVVSKFNLTLIE
jgi:hypothetical protein